MKLIHAFSWLTMHLTGVLKIHIPKDLHLSSLDITLKYADIVVFVLVFACLFIIWNLTFLNIPRRLFIKLRPKFVSLMFSEGGLIQKENIPILASCLITKEAPYWSMFQLNDPKPVLHLLFFLLLAIYFLIGLIGPTSWWPWNIYYINIVDCLSRQSSGIYPLYSHK